jgi:hypothetical protein
MSVPFLASWGESSVCRSAIGPGCKFRKIFVIDVCEIYFAVGPRRCSDSLFSASVPTITTRGTTMIINEIKVLSLFNDSLFSSDFQSLFVNQIMNNLRLWRR